MTRDDFMSFFRDEEKLNTLSVDDRLEVFSTILAGSTDITEARLEALVRDYCVEGVDVIEVASVPDRKSGQAVPPSR